MNDPELASAMSDPDIMAKLTASGGDMTKLMSDPKIMALMAKYVNAIKKSHD